MRSLWALPFALALMCGSAFAAEPLILVSNELPPASMFKPGSGEIIGSSTDLLRRAFDDADVSYRFAIYPWARAYAMALRDNDTCVYSTNRTDERETLFKWIGPLAMDGWVLYGRPDSPKLASLEDARSSVIGGYFGDSATNYLKQQHFKVDEADDNTLNPKKLVAHRIDYWVEGLLGGDSVARQAGVSGLVPVLKFRDVTVNLACNKSVPDALVTKINEVLAKLNEDGTAEAIRRRYQ